MIEERRADVGCLIELALDLSPRLQDAREDRLNHGLSCPCQPSADLTLSIPYQAVLAAANRTISTIRCGAERVDPESNGGSGSYSMLS